MFDWKDFRTSLLVTFIVFIGGAVWTLIVKYANDVSFITAWEIVRDTNIKLWICIVLILIVIVLTRRISNPSSRLQRRRNKLKELNSNRDEEEGILFKWRIYFHYDGKPRVTDMTLYCTKHDPYPLKFAHDHCMVHNCKNNTRVLNIDAIEIGIQSMVDHKWDEINKS